MGARRASFRVRWLRGELTSTFAIFAGELSSGELFFGKLISGGLFVGELFSGVRSTALVMLDMRGLVGPLTPHS